jgi:regulatory protein
VGTALDCGLRLLGRRAHSQAELRQKLRRRDFDVAEVDQAMLRLDELGYLNDAAYAERLVRRRSGSRGTMAMASELASKGIDRRVAAEALAGLGPEAQVASALRLAARLLGHRPATSYRDLLNSVGPKLMRRGFSGWAIRAACQTLMAQTFPAPEG